MKWTRAPFTGKKDDGTPIHYNGIVLGDVIGVVRLGRRATYYDVIHLPTRVSIRPNWLWLQKLATARAYAEAVYPRRTPAEWAVDSVQGIAPAITTVALDFGKGVPV